MARLQNVNTTDIGEAIRLGCRTMASVFNPADDNFPYFESVVRPSAYLAFNAMHGESHVPGRHLNALLTAEAVVGVCLDEDTIENHSRALFFSYGGLLPLPMNRQEIGGPLVNLYPHNIREGFHGLYALVRYRGLHRAATLAEASIAAIFRQWSPTRSWRVEPETVLIPDIELLIDSSDDFISGIARAIGPLVKYYRTTGYGPALELALLLKEHALSGYFPPDGTYDVRRHGTHTHSTTCVLASLAQLAALTNDAPLMERVKAFYDGGLWQIRDQLGWVIATSSPIADPDLGEINNTGDILETALILGRWGYTACFEDAERILRGHLLPAQLRDASFIKDPPNPTLEDAKSNLASRHLGAFGFPAPYGHEPLGAASISFNMDIVGGAVGSLCEAYRHIARSDDAGTWIDMLFDHETADVAIESPYTHGVLSVRAKRARPLFIRLPSWAPPAHVTVSGYSGESHLVNGYLCLSEPPVNRALRIEFPLVESEITLKHRTRDIPVRLRGDAVVAMANFGADLTFFPAP
ncbi:MAG: hypothetical protein JWO59_428 [Chloroflexi bacterium]|nr:hypothetical protein [Chloroflexota bacterium]